MPFPAQHIAVSIRRPAAEVYAFASDPRNPPRWASGLGGSIRKAGDAWVADSSIGTISIAFAVKNPFGVLDHDVTLPSGDTFYNPMRVFQNGDGSEVVFTLYRRPGMSDDAFQADAATVGKDLQALKEILEK